MREEKEMRKCEQLTEPKETCGNDKDEAQPFQLWAMVANQSSYVTRSHRSIAKNAAAASNTRPKRISENGVLDFAITGLIVFCHNRISLPNPLLQYFLVFSCCFEDIFIGDHHILLIWGDREICGRVRVRYTKGVISKMADAAAELEEGGMVRTFKDLFAGAAGGIAQVLLGESEVFAFNTLSNCPIASPCYVLRFSVLYS